MRSKSWIWTQACQTLKPTLLEQLGIQVWSIARNNVSVFFNFQRHSQLAFLTVSCLGDSAHNCWSPSPQYLLFLKFGVQYSLCTWPCSLSFPNHLSLLEQWSCISNKENESQTSGHRWVCRYTPLIGHTLSNVRILIQECHRGLLPRTWPL